MTPRTRKAGNFAGQARAILFSNHLKKAHEGSVAQRPQRCLGTLSQFVDKDVLDTVANLLEYAEEDGEELECSQTDAIPTAPPEAGDAKETAARPASSQATGGAGGNWSPMPPSAASDPLPQQTRLLDEGRPDPLSGYGEQVPVAPTSPMSGGPRRRMDRLGDKIMRKRLECPRHDQLKDLVPLLRGDPKLTKAAKARKARVEKEAREAEEARLAAAKSKRKMAHNGEALARFRAVATIVLRKVRAQDDEFFELLKSQPVIPMQKHQQPKQERRSSANEDAGKLQAASDGQDPFYHHLRHVRREPTTPRQSARRDQLALQGNFNPNFIADLAVKPRGDAQPLLAFMEQGDYVHTEHEAVDAEQVLLARKLESLRHIEPRRGPWAVPPPTNKPQVDDGHGASRSAAPRRFLAGAVGAQTKGAGKAGGAHGGEDLYRMLELLDPGHKAGVVNPDAIVPLMFWLGLTKSRAAALEVLKMAFGTREIDDGAMAVMTEHVEVQLRFIEGLRNMIRRETLDQLCEYISSNNFQRIRTWFSSMRSDNFGCVDITQVQSLFARMEVTTDRQTLFRFLSYMAENPHETAALDPREKMAILNKKFSLNGFGSLICRSAAAWCLHRTMAMLTAQPNDGPTGILDDHEIACRWIQLQRKITISLLVNQRFWGRESRKVLAALQPPQMTCPAVEDLKELTPEQWNVLFQRVSAQGLASVLPDEVEEGATAQGHGPQKPVPEVAKKAAAATPRGL